MIVPVGKEGLNGKAGLGSLAGLSVVGGQQRIPRSLRDGQQNWHGYVRGLVVGVDLTTG